MTDHECGWQAGSKHMPPHRSSELPEYPLDPGLLVVHVTEKLMQTVGLVQLCTASSCHTLNPLKAPVNGLAFILYLGRVESTAGHQTVCLTVQILQAILKRGWKRAWIAWTSFLRVVPVEQSQSAVQSHSFYYESMFQWVYERESSTSWADISASSNWCFFRRLLTDAKSFP